MVEKHLAGAFCPALDNRGDALDTSRICPFMLYPEITVDTEVLKSKAQRALIAASRGCRGHAQLDERNIHTCTSALLTLIAGAAARNPLNAGSPNDIEVKRYRLEKCIRGGEEAAVTCSCESSLDKTWLLHLGHSSEPCTPRVPCLQ